MFVNPQRNPIPAVMGFTDRECNRNTSESTARPPSSEHNLSWNIMAGEAEKHVRGLIYKTNWSILKYMYLLIKHYFDVEAILFLEKSRTDPSDFPGG